MLLRPHAEDLFADELKRLREQDSFPKPENWLLSPKMVVLFILGGTLPDGSMIEPKYFGNRRLIEVAVATLATDRALLLLGVPGTAKTWVSELISAAISGTSSLLVQGTAGMSEDALRYGWNYARLIAEGPSPEALVASPVMRGMETGKIVRVEELTRIPSDVQDSLITVLSEKVLPVPELNREIQAIRGFNIIATANDFDKGVNELSGALKRRFNTVILPLPPTVEEETEIVASRLAQMGKNMPTPQLTPPLEEIKRLVTIFQELRNGKTMNGKTKLKTPSTTLNTAEAISVMNSAIALATHFGNGKIEAKDIAIGIEGAVIKDPTHDKVVWEEYLETVIRDRDDWRDLYQACKEK